MGQPSKRFRVLIIAPSLRTVGGQSAQAHRMLEAFEGSREFEAGFQANDPEFPWLLAWVKKIPVVRTILTGFIYYPTILFRALSWDILHVFAAGNYSYMMWSMTAIGVGRLLGKKTILHYHDGRAEQHLSGHRTAVPTIRWAHRIVAPSNFLVEVFRQYGLEATAIFNTVDTSLLHYRERSRVEPKLVTNRGFHDLYNVSCTLKAFQLVQQRYPEASLDVAHDGPLRQQLEAEARDLGLKNVRFLGALTGTEMADLYDRGDIYLMTPNIDNMPMTILECYASGLPVVSTNAGGIPFIARDGETALLVGVNDHEAAAKAVMRLLESPELVERLTRNGLKETERYRAETIVAEWTRLYTGLVGS